MQKDKAKAACSVEVRKTSIGGQALIEGIIMRGPRKISMVVRNPDGEMIVENQSADAADRPKYFRWPFFRGVFGFIDSMKFGYKCLMRSAEIAGLDDEGTDSAKADTKSTSPTGADADEGAAAPVQDTAPTGPDADGEKTAVTDDNKKSNTLLMNAVMIIASVLGVVLAVLLFKALPESLFELLKKLIPALGGEGYGYQLLRSLIVGIIKIFILVGYMALVTLMKDIRRTFMYHGAEHKSIMCYEKGLELTVSNVRAQRRFHPRCGTSFLVLMVLVGIVITMFIPTRLSDSVFVNVVLRTLISLALLPVMMSVGYELIRLAGRRDNRLTRIISAPGLWLQRITTKEPDDGMIECAITALKNVIPGDGSDSWSKK